jgi:hypothetical protein
MCKTCYRECDGGWGGNRNQTKVWKEEETLTNIELIAHILKFYINFI